MARLPHVMIVEARFYDDIAEALAHGAVAELKRRGASWERVQVPGVLEIPAAVAFALKRDEQAGQRPYDGFVALGCVIRGETSHYDIVAGESARALMDLACGYGLALGNGILTVENRDQAWRRARASEKDKGGVAAAACLDMIALKSALCGDSDSSSS